MLSEEEQEMAAELGLEEETIKPIRGTRIEAEKQTVPTRDITVLKIHFEQDGFDINQCAICEINGKRYREI